MDNQPNLDFNGDKPDNSSNNANDETNIVVRLDEIEPLNDVNCEHQLEQDDDTIGEYRAWKCSKCHRGVFLHKTITVT